MDLLKKFNKDSRGVSSVLGELLIAAIFVIVLVAIFSTISFDHNQKKHIVNEEWANSSSDTIYIKHADGDAIPTEALNINVFINGTRYSYSSANISQNLGGKRFWEFSDVIAINTNQTWGVGFSDESDIYITLVDSKSELSLTKYFDRTSNSIIPSSLVLANFNAVPTSGISPLTVSFIDTSTGSPTSWQWNFDDGSSNSTLQNPTHVFTNGGIYNITLIVMKTGSCSSITKNLTVTVNQPPVANAGAAQFVPMNALFGAAVTLDGSGSTDDGLISPLTYKWTWNGGSATGQKPMVTLPPGKTIVTLTVNDGQLSSNATVNITVNKPPVANAGADQVVPMTYVENNTSATPFGSSTSDPTSLKGDIYYIPQNSQVLPDFSTLTPVGSIYTKVLDVPNTYFDLGFPGVTNRFEWFAIKYTGTFRVENEGVYKFRLNSDDGSRLFIDGNKIIDDDGVHAVKTVSGSVFLGKGDHQIEIDYFEGPRYYVALQLFWTPPGSTETVCNPQYVSFNSNNNSNNNNSSTSNLSSTAITLDGSGSTDDSLISPLTYKWTWNGGSATGQKPAVTLPPGKTIVTLTVNDGQLSSNATVNITVNKPPVANAGAGQVVELNSLSGTAVFLDGSGSTDDGTISPLTYSWIWNGGLAFGQKPVVPLPQGKTTITLKVSDGQLSSNATVNITVKDTTLPKITPCAPILWSPNHQYNTISISDLVSSVTDVGDLSVGVGNIVITNVSSDEPDKSGGSNKGSDIVIPSDAKSVDLRAERMGSGNGRVYTINYKVTDVSGNTARGLSQVWVPHDMGGNTAVDDGPSYIVKTQYYP